MLASEIIAKKRDSNPLSRDEVRFMVQGITDGHVSEGQAAALAMAILLNGMELDETVALTLAMRDSGTTLNWDDLPGPAVDKHSTGGIGDKVSLILAPILAACGAFVPMISGRGLGHTGGTLDKLEAIPGYTITQDPASLQHTLRAAGCAIVGQTDDLAPADRRLYAIRDVTATVESLPLIVASILSKKFAAGPKALVMDVKCGNGAFMTDLGSARELGQMIIDVANLGGMKARGLITDMNQCLGTTAGNALEVEEAIQALTNRSADGRLMEITSGVASELLCLAGLAATDTEANSAVEQALASGRAAECFEKMVAMLGGPADLLTSSDKLLPKAPVQKDFLADRSGQLLVKDTRALGLAVIELGGGRKTPGDTIDHSVGLSNITAAGSKVEKGAALLTIHARSEDAADRVTARLSDAIEIAEDTHGRPVVGPAIIERL